MNQAGGKQNCFHPVFFQPRLPALTGLVYNGSLLHNSGLITIIKQENVTSLRQTIIGEMVRVWIKHAPPDLVPCRTYLQKERPLESGRSFFIKFEEVLCLCVVHRCHSQITLISPFGIVFSSLEQLTGLLGKCFLQ